MLPLAAVLLGCLAALPAQDRVAVAEPRVLGRVTDEHGKPIEGVSLVVQPRDEFVLPASAAPLARTDAAGRFALTLPPPEPSGDRRSLLLTATGWSTVLVGDAWSWQPLASHGEVDLGEIVLLPGAMLRGRVTTAGGQPLARVRVESRDPLARLLHGWRPHAVAYASATITAEDGSFALVGLPPGGTGLVFTADGHYRREIQFVLPGEPLAISMTPSGHIEGVVRDETGRPCAGANLWVHYAAGEHPEQHRAAQDGTFRITLAFPHAYRIEPTSGPWAHHVGPPPGVTRVGPARNLVLTSNAIGDPQRTLLLRVTAASGNAVEAVLAAALWTTPELHALQPGPTVALAMCGMQLRGPGEFRLPGPPVSRATSGLIVVTAAGHAPLVIDDVEWSDRDPPVLEAKMVRESVLTGTVIDPGSRQPVRGAMVSVEGRFDGIPSDREGRFRVGGLNGGRHDLQAFLPSRPPGEIVAVDVAAGATRSDIVLELPAGSRVTGKLSGIEPAVGWRADVERGPLRRGIAADGTFVVTGLVNGEHDLRLLIPHRGGRCGSLELRVGTVQIQGKDVEQGFDVGAVRPGTIRGTVTVAGADIAMHRLAVAVIAPPLHVRYLVEPIAADGTFALPVVPGTPRIEIIDLATRVRLAVVDHVRVSAGEVTELPVHVELVAVHVELRLEQADQALPVSSLQVLVEHDGPNPVPATNDGTLDQSGGVLLAGAADHADLLLPPRPTQLLVRSNLEFVRDGEMVFPLGDARLTPSQGSADRVEIVVRMPPRQERK